MADDPAIPHGSGPSDGQKKRIDLALPSFVQPLESNQQIRDWLNLTGNYMPRPEFSVCPATPEELLFRHSGVAHRRFLAWNGLLAIHESQQTLDMFRNCGAALWLEASESGDDLRLRCNKCHNRWCPKCAAERAAKITANMREHLEGRQVRFVTFTRRHSHAPLSDQITGILRCFAELRRRVFWKDKCPGGAGFLEIKIGRDGLWHVHLHVLCETKWMDQKTLSDQWLAVTNDSTIVDIRPVPDLEARIKYVTKYVTKPADSEVFHDHEKLCEVMIAMKGRHVCMTFGTWRGWSIDGKPEKSGSWKAIGSISSLIDQALHGEERAVRFIEAAARKFPTLQFQIPTEFWPPDG